MAQINEQIALSISDDEANSALITSLSPPVHWRFSRWLAAGLLSCFCRISPHPLSLSCMSIVYPFLMCCIMHLFLHWWWLMMVPVPWHWIQHPIFAEWCWFADIRSLSGSVAATGAAGKGRARAEVSDGLPVCKVCLGLFLVEQGEAW